ncbi:MAG: UDP-N-acetylmuramate--L-alanine ligase [Rickettsiales bacterium]|nr:UDP-N-acetylmuramate--L-alanine ligase [Rickettsiales bacterium]|tara:strand:- start:11850 stop:13259 length:1410 start_codon:yes stop_codon:yes gene_type:complete
MLNISPLTISKIHIIGIGGIGMSGIAKVLAHMGYQVQGSDQQLSANIERLNEQEIDVKIGHQENNITSDIEAIVYSSAVDQNNPELIAGKKLGIPLLKRAEMLSELMRFYHTIAISGSHGKTTTTSLIGHVLKDISPTVINGGVANQDGSNVQIGSGQWMVVEADESDATFVRVPATVGVVTNIDPEHLEFYGSFESVIDHFKQFIEGIAFYGFAVLCYDHTEVRNLAVQAIDTRVITYGFEAGADYQICRFQSDLTGIYFDVCTQDKEIVFENIFVPLHGKHNALNALAAVVVALKLRVAPDSIRKQLACFEGVRRRFSKTAITQNIQYIDDYAHHPVEIKAVIETAKPLTKGKLVVVFQPHRYSRLDSLFENFLDSMKASDHLFVLPVYEAGEIKNNRKDHVDFAQAYQSETGGICHTIDSKNQLAHSICELNLPIGSTVLFVGAGDITKWAYEIPSLVEEKIGQSA